MKPPCSVLLEAEAKGGVFPSPTCLTAETKIRGNLNRINRNLSTSLAQSMLFPFDGSTGSKLTRAQEIFMHGFFHTCGQLIVESSQTLFPKRLRRIAR